jgi:hypothetical protein
MPGWMRDGRNLVIAGAARRATLAIFTIDGPAISVTMPPVRDILPGTDGRKRIV